MSTRSEEEWIGVYQEKGAWWRHDGNMLRPHVRLTWGKHSTGYVDSPLVLEDASLLFDVAFDILQMFIREGGEIEKVDGVVGPRANLAEAMANIVGNSCFSASPEKSEKGKERVMIFGPEDLALLAGKSVLLCDDVFTTGGSVQLVARAVGKASGIVLPFVTVPVNRSGLKEVNGRKIVAPINRYMPKWFPENCPPCKQGSKALYPPKDPANWVLLNAPYPEEESV